MTTIPVNRKPSVNAFAPVRARSPRLHIMCKLFLISLIIPFQFDIGFLRLSASRLFLLVMFVPLFLTWIRGGAGKIRFVDVSLLLFCLWSTLSFMLIHGVSKGVEASGILIVETMGAYLLARVYIRNAYSFYAMVAFLFGMVVILLPFALMETLTSRNLILSTANALGSSYDVVPKEPRWGLDRVQGPFSHPILFGVFCGAILTLVYFVLGFGRSWLRRVAQTAVVGFTAGLSLSSGPLSAMMAQVSLLIYDGALRWVRGRWLLLAGAVAVLIVLVELLANRTSTEIFIGLFAFSKHTAYNRLDIWTYGSASVLNNPLIGIGMNDWARPVWMVESVDMFWLLPAMRHGIPAGLFLQITVVGLFMTTAFKRIGDRRVASYRLGFVLCLFGYYLAGWTVHYWNEVYLHLMFILGSGVWILDWQPRRDGAAPMRRPQDAPERRDH